MKVERYADGSWKDETANPPEESSLSLVVNGAGLVTIQCSPYEQVELGIGFLYSNGIIDGVDEISAVDYSGADDALYVRLVEPVVVAPRRIVITTGFGGGPVFGGETSPYGETSSFDGGGETLSFGDVGELPYFDGGFTISPALLASHISVMKSRAVKYRESGGIHATALCSRDGVIFVSEDVGRQNSMDKVIGRCLMDGIGFSDKAMLTTGRVSFEMVLKTVRAGIPVLASLSAATVKAVERAEICGLTVAGYATDKGFVAYSHKHRFIAEQ